MKKIINALIILFTMIPFQINSQIHYDILYLNDGTIVRGALIESTPEQKKIRLLTGNTLVYNDTIIKKIENKYIRHINYTSAGMITGSALNEKPTVLTIMTEYNYNFLKYFGFGPAFGVELLNETTLPLAMTLKTYLPLNNRTLYLNGTLGYSFSIEKPTNIYELTKAYGGPMASLELGVLIPLNYRNGFFLSLGYRYSELDYKYDDWWRGSIRRTYFYNRLIMRLGIALY